MRSRKHDKAHLLAQKIRWRTAQSGDNQPLLHGSKAGFQRASGQKLYILVGVHTKVLEYVSRYDLEITAEDIEPYRLSAKLWDRLKLRPGDERSGGAGYVTGHDFDRNPSHRSGSAWAEGRIIIDFSGH